jgi:tRNA pseudouridine38/39 synthase
MLSEIYRKPQYTLASELPLNLFQCTYSEVEDWVYDREALIFVINDYQSMWTEHRIK